jgi:hypothetical protein
MDVGDGRVGNIMVALPGHSGCRERYGRLNTDRSRQGQRLMKHAPLEDALVLTILEYEHDLLGHRQLSVDDAVALLVETLMIKPIVNNVTH